MRFCRIVGVLAVMPASRMMMMHPQPKWTGGGVAQAESTPDCINQSPRAWVC